MIWPQSQRSHFSQIESQISVINFDGNILYQKKKNEVNVNENVNQGYYV